MIPAKLPANQLDGCMENLNAPDDGILHYQQRQRVIRLPILPYTPVGNIVRFRRHD